MIVYSFTSEDAQNWTLSAIENESGALLNQRRFQKGLTTLSVSDTHVSILSEGNEIVLSISAIQTPSIDGIQSAFDAIAQIVN